MLPKPFKEMWVIRAVLFLGKQQCIMQDYIFKPNCALGIQNGDLWGCVGQSETARKPPRTGLWELGVRVPDKTNGIIKDLWGRRECGIHIHILWYSNSNLVCLLSYFNLILLPLNLLGFCYKIEAVCSFHFSASYYQMKSDFILYFNQNFKARHHFLGFSLLLPAFSLPI